MMWHGVFVHKQHIWATGCCEHDLLDDGSQVKPWIKQGHLKHYARVFVVTVNEL